MNPRTHVWPKLLRALIVALAGTASTQPAHADSIVFIKDHNVWIAKADGSGARPITRDGDGAWPYRSPSQADDGRISAGHGTDIVQLDQQGNQLAIFAPKGPEGSTAFKGLAPQDIAVSADGSKVAYTIYGYSCVPGVSCGTRQMTGYMSADGREYYGYELGLTGPEWVSPDTVLAFGGLFRQVVFDSIDTADSDGRTWFNDPDDIGLGDGELSRQSDLLAVVRGDGNDYHLLIFTVDGTSGTPKPACATGAEPTLNDPSWSPDGTMIAFEHQEGIEVLSLPNVVDGDCPGARSGGVVIPGGSEPDWGPADVQPRYEISADAVPGTNLRKALRKGLKLTVESNFAGTLSGNLLVDGNTVASGSASLAAGKGTITFRFAKKARKQLAKRKQVTIYAELVFESEAGVVVPVTGTVEVKR